MIKVTVTHNLTVYVQGKPLTLRSGKYYPMIQVQGSRVLIELAENVYTWVSARQLKA